MARQPETIIHLAGEEFLPGLCVGLRLRFSPRARRLIVRVVPGLGVELVVPEGASREEALAFAESRAEWIVRTVERLRARGALFPLPGDAGAPGAALPEGIELRALGRRLAVAALTRPGAFRLLEHAGGLVLSGPLDDPGTRALALERLRRWVLAQAKAALPALLRAEAGRTGLDYDAVTVRRQRTRWGSCSMRGGRASISLNAKLLFLPPALCNQVLLHELCHTKRQDHSPAFWALVERHAPGGRAQERELASAWRFVPGWWAAP
ncbi:MAG: M48 family metallopeptidase [Desulfovibrionaceae bacterium]